MEGFFDNKSVIRKLRDLPKVLHSGSRQQNVEIMLLYFNFFTLPSSVFLDAPLCCCLCLGDPADFGSQPAWLTNNVTFHTKLADKHQIPIAFSGD